MSHALPLALPRTERQIWSIGGGKGGIGKSVLTAALGWQLARLGRRVVLVDADLGGANLHTCLGVAPPSRTLGDFINRRVEKIEDAVVDTPFPRLRLLSGAADLSAANISHQQKVRVIGKLRALDVDVVLVDLGAGTSFHTLDFFLVSQVGLLVVVPEPTSIENGYRFIKSVVYRRLRGVADDPEVRTLVDSALDPNGSRRIRTPVELIEAVQRESASAADALRRELAAFHPRFVVNQVRGPQDVAVGHQLVTACARHLGIRAGYAGYVQYHDDVWQSVRQRRLFAAEDPDGKPAQEIRQVVRGLMHDEPLRFSW